jgi:hypothetical protein
MEDLTSDQKVCCLLSAICCLLSCLYSSLSAVFCLLSEVMHDLTSEQKLCCLLSALCCLLSYLPSYPLPRPLVIGSLLAALYSSIVCALTRTPQHFSHPKYPSLRRALWTAVRRRCLATTSRLTWVILITNPPSRSICACGVIPLHLYHVPVA